MNYDGDGSDQYNQAQDSKSEPEAISQVVDKDLSDRGHTIDNDDIVDTKKNKLLFIALGVGFVLACAAIWFFVLAPQQQPALPESTLQEIKPQEMQSVALPATPEETPTSGVVSVSLDATGANMPVSSVVPVNQVIVQQPVSVASSSVQAAPFSQAQVVQQPLKATPQVQAGPEVVQVPVPVQVAVNVPPVRQARNQVKKRSHKVEVKPEVARNKKKTSDLYEIYAIKDGRAWVRDMKNDTVIMIMVDDIIPGAGKVNAITDDRIDLDNDVVIE